MNNNQNYKIGLLSPIDSYCEVKIDSKSIGKFFLRPNKLYKLERPVNETKRFTFVSLLDDNKIDSNKKVACFDKNSNEGLIEVVFCKKKIIFFFFFKFFFNFHFFNKKKLIINMFMYPHNHK